MGNNSVPKFIFRLSRFPVYRGSVLGRFYCIIIINVFITESTINVFLHHRHHHNPTNTLFVTHFFLVECIKPLDNIRNKNLYNETILLLQKVVTH